MALLLLTAPSYGHVAMSFKAGQIGPIRNANGATGNGRASVAGPCSGAGTFGATREARATVRCLDSRVAYRAYFATQRLARGVDAHAPGAREREGEPALGEVTPALEATPGSALPGEC